MHVSEKNLVRKIRKYAACTERCPWLKFFCWNTTLLKIFGMRIIKF